MVTCHLRYILNPQKLKEFEHYGELWIPLVEKFGGKHHGYFLPSEGANNIGLAMFTFPSLAEYEQYRKNQREIKVRLYGRTSSLSTIIHPCHNFWMAFTPDACLSFY